MKHDYRQQKISIKTKEPRNLLPVFEKIIKGVDEKYKNKDGTFKMNPVTQKTFTEQEYQDEMDAIADTRNSGSKVPKKFSQEGKKEAIESMVKIKSLERLPAHSIPQFFMYFFSLFLTSIQ